MVERCPLSFSVVRVVLHATKAAVRNLKEMLAISGWWRGCPVSTSSIHSLADSLLQALSKYERCVVAFSAGVDSSVVAKAAAIALGDRAMAVTAVSPSLASGELEEALALAKMIGICHETIRTNELAQDGYRRNLHDRCYFCKTELYAQIQLLVEAYPDCVIANGTNCDDLSDHRPGLVAADEHRVRSPLVECGLRKHQVRDLAAHWELPVWDKPAAPCLSSRLAYGVTVTPERLQMVDQAERFLRQEGFRELRVRYHEGDLARIEVPQEAIEKLAQEPLRSEVEKAFRDLGFKFVTIDLAGFRSGGLNALIPPESLVRGKPD